MPRMIVGIPRSPVWEHQPLSKQMPLTFIVPPTASVGTYLLTYV